MEDHQLQITLRLSNLSNDFERKMQLTDVDFNLNKNTKDKKNEWGGSAHR